MASLQQSFSSFLNVVVSRETGSLYKIKSKTSVCVNQFYTFHFPVAETRAAHCTFEHPQDDAPVVHVGSVEADRVIRPGEDGPRQRVDLAEGSVVPLCGLPWYRSQSWLDVLLNLLNRHWQLFVFQWVYPRRRCLERRRAEG